VSCQRTSSSGFKPFVADGSVEKLYTLESVESM